MSPSQRMNMGLRTELSSRVLVWISQSAGFGPHHYKLGREYA